MKKLAFLHIPKTAGSSVHRAFAKTYQDAALATCVHNSLKPIRRGEDTAERF